MASLVTPLLCLLLGQCPTTTVPPAVCSVPNCHVFKDGSLVLFVGKLDVDLKEPSTTVCNPFGGNIFIPRTMEDNQIWLEFTRKIYNESSSFEVIFYPVIYYSGENPYWKWYGDTECSIPHCRVFKNGNLILFPGKESFTTLELYDKNLCDAFDGSVFVPKTKEDNQIWVKYTKMLHKEKNSFNKAWYPMWCLIEDIIHCNWFDNEKFAADVEDSDYVLKINDPGDGQSDLKEVDINDYTNPQDEDISYVYFAHDVENYYGQLQIYSGSKPVGVAICFVNKS